MTTGRLLTADDLGAKLITLFGLDDLHVTGINIKMEAKKAVDVTISTEIHIGDRFDGYLENELSTYNLIEKEDSEK